MKPQTRPVREVLNQRKYASFRLTLPEATGLFFARVPCGRMFFSYYDMRFYDMHGNVKEFSPDAWRRYRQISTPARNGFLAGRL